MILCIYIASEFRNTHWACVDIFFQKMYVQETDKTNRNMIRRFMSTKSTQMKFKRKIQ